MDLIEKSDAMKQQDKYTEEIVRHRPKHARKGGPIEPLHGLVFLALLFAQAAVIGYLIHG